MMIILSSLLLGGAILIIITSFFFYDYGPSFDEAVEVCEERVLQDNLKQALLASTNNATAAEKKSLGDRPLPPPPPLQQAFEHRWLALEGIGRIHSISLKATTATSGPVVVFIHGYGISAALTWSAIMPRLILGGGCQEAIAVDMPGFGRSSADPTTRPPTDATPERIVDYLCTFLHRYLEAMGLYSPPPLQASIPGSSGSSKREVILIGHSFGAYIAAKYTSLHPHHPLRLILLSPAGLLPTGGVLGYYWSWFLASGLIQAPKHLGHIGVRVVLGLANMIHLPSFFHAYYLHQVAPDTPGPKWVGQVWGRAQGKATWHAPLLLDLLDFPPHLPVSLLYGALDSCTPYHQGQAVAKVRRSSTGGEDKKEEEDEDRSCPVVLRVDSIPGAPHGLFLFHAPEVSHLLLQHLLLTHPAPLPLRPSSSSSVASGGQAPSPLSFHFLHEEEHSSHFLPWVAYKGIQRLYHRLEQGIHPPPTPQDDNQKNR